MTPNFGNYPSYVEIDSEEVVQGYDLKGVLQGYVGVT